MHKLYVNTIEQKIHQELYVFVAYNPHDYMAKRP